MGRERSGLFTSFALVLENEFGPWMNFAIAAGFLVMWTTVFCLYYRHKFPNHTHVNLKKFNLMLRATQQRKKQKQGTQEQVWRKGHERISFESRSRFGEWLVL